MLDLKTAKIVQKAINDHFYSPSQTEPMVTLEAVTRMEPVVQNTRGSGHTILALQYGDLTILVWVSIVEKPGAMVVNRVNSVSW